jgi:hypothetical protein
MTRIGAVCLVTIGIWIIIELSVQFGEPSKGRLLGNHRHTCGIGVGARPASAQPLLALPLLLFACWDHAVTGLGQALKRSVWTTQCVCCPAVRSGARLVSGLTRCELLCFLSRKAAAESCGPSSLPPGASTTFRARLLQQARNAAHL